MATVTNYANNNLVLRWIAQCSNTDRSIEEIKKLTEELLVALENVPITYAATMDRLCDVVRTVYTNRNNDFEFLELMSTMNNRLLVGGALDAAINNHDMDLSTFIENTMKMYTEKFGDDRDLLNFQLRYYTLTNNYSKNRDKVEIILEKLASLN